MKKLYTAPMLEQIICQEDDIIRTSTLFSTDFKNVTLWSDIWTEAE